MQLILRMKIEKSFNKEKTLNPDIISYFKEIPEGYLFNKEHSRPLRHPGAIFNISFNEVIIGMINVLTILNETRNDPENKDFWKKLLWTHKYLYYEFCSFYDECFLILMTLCKPSNNSIEAKFAYEWLQKNGFQCGTEFNSSANHIIKPIQEINNRLKHNNQRLVGFKIITDSKKLILGYYVEGLQNSGSVGPDLNIHEERNHITTGFSFNRELKMMFTILYLLSDKLLLSIKKYLKQTYSFNFKNKEYIKHNELLEKLWILISELDYYFLVNEFNKRFPKIEINKNLFGISFPHKDKIFDDEGFRITSTIDGDGYTNFYQLPYFFKP